ncbi:hypothetical protein BX600DRAFT_468643 [Xylariales sp. PMI_506]|nr:hypothetical protein BX600DRAFT_468643 [Xylariales sp. PMI_506]
MAPLVLSFLRDAVPIPPAADEEPIAARICSLIVALAANLILGSLLTQRFVAVKDWRSLPWIMWLVFLIYSMSILYVCGAVIVQYGVGTGRNATACSAAMIVCLSIYLSIKVLIYLFLIDRAHIIRGTTKSRLKSKLYLFNVISTLTIYCSIGSLDFIYREPRQDAGTCIISISKYGLVPTITFDAVTNIYLTILFLKPLLASYSIRVKSLQSTSLATTLSLGTTTNPPNPRLRALAIRTIVGGICTLFSSLINITVLSVLDGEISWICLLCCTSDVVFSALIIHWVT